jgi:preprotein translocase subunit Sss1
MVPCSLAKNIAMFLKVEYLRRQFGWTVDDAAVCRMARRPSDDEIERVQQILELVERDGYEIVEKRRTPDGSV